MGARLIVNFFGETGETYRLAIRNSEAVKIGTNTYTELTPAFWNFNTILWDSSCDVPNDITVDVPELCVGSGLFSLVLPTQLHNQQNMNLDYHVFKMLGPTTSWANYQIHTDCGCSLNIGIPDLTFNCQNSHAFGNC